MKIVFLLCSSLHFKALFGVKFISILQKAFTQKLIFLPVSTYNPRYLALVLNKVFTVIN